MFRARYHAVVAFLAHNRVRVAALASAFALAGAAGTAFAQEPAGGKAAAPDPKRGSEIAQQVCAACHGADGNSAVPANPKLAAQHAGYIAKQLADFKAPEGGQPARASAIMQGFASMLSPDDVRNVAAWFSAQALQPSAAKDQALAETGRNIYRAGIAEKGVPACAACHSPDGAGIPVQYPRVGGQFAEYTEAQLVAFRQGARANSEPMKTIAERLSDHEIKAVADYMAGLR